MDDFRRWGSLGGKKSRRTLTTAEARKMAQLSMVARRQKQAGKQSSGSVRTKAAHGTEEWAAHNVNVQLGCEHDCKYCYAKCMAIRFRRSSCDDWRHPEVLDAKVQKRYRKMQGPVMFPTSHDITPRNVADCIQVLRSLLVAGNDVLVVSKPHLSCIKDMCAALKEYRDQLLFRFTIGSADSDVLAFWEPSAPSYSERLKALRWAYGEGFRTSVSAEPILDIRIDKVIVGVKPFVTDAVWLGRVNRLRGALAINCPDETDAFLRADELLSQHSDDWVTDLYNTYRYDRMIKWKDSIKKVVGLERPTVKGLDV